MDGAFTVEVEGATLAGERRGTGDPLVFLHGMAGDMADWDRLWAALPADLPRLRYDLRGFGDSPARNDAPFSHTDDLLALLDAQGIARAVLVGLSMGGGIALNLALSHPERVSRLVLISPAMVGWTWSDAWKDIWRGVARAAKDGDIALARQRWLDHPMFERVLQGEAADDFRAAIGRYHGRQWVRDHQRAELPDVDRLHALAVPTLLMSGEHDVADIRLIADVITGAAPGVTRRDFAGAGHMLHLESPHEVADAIVGFLGG